MLKQLDIYMGCIVSQPLILIPHNNYIEIINRPQ